MCPVCWLTLVAYVATTLTCIYNILMGVALLSFNQKCSHSSLIGHRSPIIAHHLSLIAHPSSLIAYCMLVIHIGDIFAGTGSLSKRLLSYWEAQSSDDRKQSGAGAQVISQLYKPRSHFQVTVLCLWRKGTQCISLDLAVRHLMNRFMPGFWNSSYPENLKLFLEQETVAF